MKKIYFTLACLFFSFAAQAAPVPLDKVVAVVNNSVVTENQLNQTIQTLKQQMQAKGEPLPSDAVLRKKALDQAIGEVLQLQIAQRVNIVATDADVDRAIASIAKQNNLTVDQLKTAISQQGINYKTYRKQLQDQIILQQLQQQALAAKVQVSPAEVDAYLKKAPPPNLNSVRYHVDDLLIPLPNDATPEQITAVKKQATELLQKARSGESFAQLAQGPVQHIDLQWRTVKDFPDIFVNIVPTLKVNEVTVPIKAPNGFHLLRLLAVEGQTTSLTRAEAQQAVLQKKIQQETEKWVQELRKTAYVKVM